MKENSSDLTQDEHVYTSHPLFLDTRQPFGSGGNRGSIEIQSLEEPDVIRITKGVKEHRALIRHQTIEQ